MCTFADGPRHKAELVSDATLFATHRYAASMRSRMAPSMLAETASQFPMTLGKQQAAIPSANTTRGPAHSARHMPIMSRKKGVEAIVHPGTRTTSPLQCAHFAVKLHQPLLLSWFGYSVIKPSTSAYAVKAPFGAHPVHPGPLPASHSFLHRGNTMPTTQYHVRSKYAGTYVSVTETTE